MLSLSQRERDELVVIRQVAEKRLQVMEGARRLGIGVRQMRRKVRKHEVEIVDLPIPPLP